MLKRAEELRAGGQMPQEVFDRIRQAAVAAAPELAAEGGEQDPRPALIILAEAGDADGVEQELARPLADPDTADRSGTTALLVAVRKGHADVARLLVRKGADVNKAGAWGFTPLMYTAIWGQLDLAKHLLQSGADPHAKDVRGETALEHAVGERKPEIADAIRAALGGASGAAEPKFQDWKLSPFEEGLVVSLVYIGVMCGNFASGPIGDMYGRRFPIVISFWLVFLLSVLCAFSVDFLMLCCLRILVGVAMGVGQPAFQALLTETTPANSRVVLFSLAFCLFAIGEMYSAVLIDIDDPQMNNLHWRWLLAVGALPALFFGILALKYIDQSPYYLSINERHEEARDVLRRMSTDNFLDQLDVTFDTARVKRKQTEPEKEVFQWRLLVSEDMICTTAIMVYSCFVLNFIFYGCLYAFPNVMTDVDLGSTPAASLILGALVELAGLLIAIVVATTWPRKLVMKIYLSLVAISLLCFAIAAEGDGTLYAAMRSEGYYGIKFFTSIGYIVAYLYVTEVYPTACRTTGTSVCLAGGRLGAIISPEIFEAVEELSGSFTLYFYLIAALAGLNFYLVNSLTHETQGMLLRETADEAMVSAGDTSSRRPRAPTEALPAIDEDYDPANPNYVQPPASAAAAAS